MKKFGAKRITWSAMKEGDLFACPNYCGKKYKHRESLRNHLKFECGISPQFPCAFCGKAFNYKNSLKSHVAVKHRQLIA